MRYIIYVPATLLPAVHHSSTRRRVITSFGPYSTLRTRVLCKSSFSCLPRRIIREAVSSLGPLWSPLTAIVPVPPSMRPLEYLRPGDSAAERKLSQPVPDTLNPFGSIRIAFAPPANVDTQLATQRYASEYSKVLSGNWTSFAIRAF